MIIYQNHTMIDIPSILVILLTTLISHLGLYLYRNWKIFQQARDLDISRETLSNLSPLEIENMVQLNMKENYIKKIRELEERIISDSFKVKEFTQEGRGIICPTIPRPMGKENTKFIIRMVMSEMQELAKTVTSSTEESLLFMQECLESIDICQKDLHGLDDDKKASEQLDAMVDAYYYMQDTACKHGMNMSSMFEVVHRANMSKKWKDGKFHRREDGKILKPDNWEEPDTYGEIKRQIKKGSWSK